MTSCAACFGQFPEFDREQEDSDSDLTTRKIDAERELQRLFSIIEHAPALISTTDRDGNITYFNKTGREWLRLNDDGQPSGWRLAPNSMEIALQAAEQGVWQGEREHFLGQRPGTQKGRAVLQTVRAHKGPDGEVDFYSTIAIDISEQKRLEQERLRLLSVLEDTPAYVSTADAQGQILYFNRAARRLLGIGYDEEIGSMTIPETHPEWAARLIAEEGLPTATQDGSWQGETAILTPEGDEVPVLQVIVAHKDRSGTIQYYSSISKDITERKRMEERLHYLATHDGLTGVTNRARFQQYLEQELALAQQSGIPGAVLYLDLDNFKDINDSLGHHAGDEILQRVARLVQDNLRDTDELARLGGDEFAVLLPNTELEDAKKTGQRLLTMLSGEAICRTDRAIRVQASMGIATYPQAATTVEDVLIHADLSMYESKRNGGNRLSVYREAQKDPLSPGIRENWEELCQDALRNDRFVLHWQPLVDLRHKNVPAYELLLRMQGSDGKLVLPGEFLPACKRSDIIQAIDRWVLAKAIDLLAARAASGAEAVRVHVNLSRGAFADRMLLPSVQKQLAATGVDPSYIVLELTETMVIENVHRAIGFMEALRRLGFRCALDDFGVGFSTFNILRRLPVDYLNIDGSFIAELRQDTANQHFVRAIVEIAKGLNKHTVAKFVPDGQTRQLLQDYGVNLGQGFFLGRPGPIGDS